MVAGCKTGGILEAVTLGGLAACCFVLPCTAAPTLLFDLTRSFILNPTDPARLLTVFGDPTDNFPPQDQNKDKWCSVSYSRGSSDTSHYRTGDTVGSYSDSPAPTVHQADHRAWAAAFNGSTGPMGLYSYGRIANYHTRLPICPGYDADQVATTWDGVNLNNSNPSGMLILKSKVTALKPAGTYAQPANEIIINAPAGNPASGAGVDMIVDARQNLLEYFKGYDGFPKDMNKAYSDDGQKITQNISLKCLTCNAYPGIPIIRSDLHPDGYDKLFFDLKVTPIDNQSVKTTCFATAPPDDPNDEAHSAAQCPLVNIPNDFEMGPGNVTWRAPECATQSGDLYAYCSKIASANYESDFAYILFLLFQHFSNNQQAGHREGGNSTVYPFYTEGCTTDANGTHCPNIGTDPQTGNTPIYKVNLRPFIATAYDPMVNPFTDANKVNTVVELRGDMEGVLKNAVRDIKMMYPQQLPPRLCETLDASGVNVIKRDFPDQTNVTPPNQNETCPGTTTPESWVSYAKHFFINTPHVAYEVSGQTVLHFKVNDFTMYGCLPSDASDSHCN